MPEHASRAAALFDQFEDDNRIADWGGDELFTQMPRPRAVDDAPPPRFRPSLAGSEPAAPGSAGWEPAAPGSAAPGSAASEPAASDPTSPSSPAAPSAASARARERSLALVERPAADRATEAPAAPDDHARTPRSGDHAMRERAERLGLSVVEPAHRGDESGAMIDPEPAGRRTKVITGHPGGAPRPRPLPTVRAERRRPARTPAEWIGARPERIVAWAFVLGLILILVAVATAGAASN
jgi:hypothetical protein